MSNEFEYLLIASGAEVAAVAVAEAEAEAAADVDAEAEDGVYEKSDVSNAKTSSYSIWK